MTDLLLRPTAESRPGCEEGSPDDYDVVGPGGLIIGRIFKAITSPPGTPWMWTLAYGQDEDRSRTHGFRGDPGGRHASVRQELAREEEKPPCVRLRMLSR